MQNTLATFTALATQIYAACPWLAAGTVMGEEPPTPYQGPKPYGVLVSPRNSRAHRESGSVGNEAGRPNHYVLAYYETIYVANAQRQTEKDRVYQTYDAIATALVRPYGEEDEDFPASDLAVAMVELEHEPRGPFIAGPDGLYIGGLMHIYLEERYSTS